MVACYRLNRIIDLKAEDKEIVHLDLLGYQVQTFLLFASRISPSNHFLRDVLTLKTVFYVTYPTRQLYFVCQRGSEIQNTHLT